jgi:hypothetical protein
MTAGDNNCMVSAYPERVWTSTCFLIHDEPLPSLLGPAFREARMNAGPLYRFAVLHRLAVPDASSGMFRLRL